MAMTIVCIIATRGGDQKKWPTAFCWNDHLKRANGEFMSKVDLLKKSIVSPDL
jgi:hypothetical protein